MSVEKNKRKEKFIPPFYGLWFSTEQCAQLLNVSKSKAAEWIGSGKGRLPSFKIDGFRMVHRKDLMQFADMMRSEGADLRDDIRQTTEKGE